MQRAHVTAPILAGLVAVLTVVACDSSEPGEGLMQRLEREKRDEIAAEVKRQVEIEKEKMRAEMEAEQRRSGLVVTLPKGAAAQIDPAAMSLVIQVPVAGDLVVAGKPLRDEDLDKLFRAAFQRDKQTQVIIQADKGAGHGRVVAVMERAKAAGLTRLAIGTSAQ